MFRARSRLGALLNSQDDRHATAGCLLSALLLLPYFCRYYGVSFVLIIGAVYAGLIVPLIMSYIPPLVFFASALKLIQGLAKRSLVMICGAIEYFRRWNKEFAEFTMIKSTANQIAFFKLAEKIICPDRHFSSLYMLLLLNMVLYLKNSMQDRRWYPNLSSSDSGALTRAVSAFVAVRLARGVVLAFVLGVLGTQLRGHEPGLSYLFFSVLYFLLTEPRIKCLVTFILEKVNLNLLEGLEKIWGSVIRLFLVMFIAFCFISSVMMEHPYTCIIAYYFCIYCSYFDLKTKTIPALIEAKQLLNDYRYLNKFEIDEMEETVCAICLENMSFARQTPCNHVFHGHCLRRCLQNSNLCPLCKQNIK